MSRTQGVHADEPTRVALLGLGAMGRLHARTLVAATLAGVDGAVNEAAFTLTGAFDPEDDVHASSGLARFESEDAAIASADLVVVATPIAAHAGAAIRALDAGRDVFVEKPIGATFRDAAAMVDAARRSGRQLFVGHSERFNPVIGAIARAVSPLDIRRIVLRRLGPPRRTRPHEAVLLNLGVHDLDLVAYLTRSTLTIRAAHGTEDAAEITVATASACDARLSVARTATTRERTILVETSDAVWRGNLLTLELDVTSLASRTTRTLVVEDVEPLVAQAQALALALRSVTTIARTTSARTERSSRSAASATSEVRARSEASEAVDARSTSPVATGIDGARAVLAVEEAEACLRRALSSPTPRARPAENL